MRRNAFVKAAGLGAAALLAVAACGGGGGDDSGSGGDTSALKLGYVLPETGDLAYHGPPQVEAMNLAIKEINDAGGVLDNDIADPVGGDEANDQAIASQSADRVPGKDADATIGAAASGVAVRMIEQINCDGGI